MLVKTHFNGNPLIGVYCTASEALALVPRTANRAFSREVRRALEVEVLPLLIGGSTLVGAQCVINSYGCVASNISTPTELEQIREQIPVAVIEGPLNAMGNIVLSNDSRAMIHPELGDSDIQIIEEILQVQATRGTIAGLGNVGSLARANNSGIICHPKTTAEEMHALREWFDVEVDIGTINFGSGYLGSGCVANTKGAMMGQTTTGPEMNRIERTLGFLDRLPTPSTS